MTKVIWPPAQAANSTLFCCAGMAVGTSNRAISNPAGRRMPAAFLDIAINAPQPQRMKL
jgi:hypothetical protein